jgi:hypothetical protein
MIVHSDVPRTHLTFLHYQLMDIYGHYLPCKMHKNHELQVYKFLYLYILELATRVLY